MSLAVADQALFALSNFALNILLARWLTPSEYGAFAVAFGIFLLVATTHQAVLIEPMMVFGAGRFTERFSAYAEAVLRGHFTFTGVVSAALLVVAAIAAVTDHAGFASAMLGLAVAAPFILFQWLMRRACYVCSRLGHAVSAGAAYMLIVVPGAYLLYRAGALSVFTAFALTGAASLFTASWLRWRLRLRDAGERFDFSQMLAAHWEYGRWALGTGGLNWANSNVLMLLMPIFLSLAAAGTFKAAINLIMPLWQTGAAVATVLLPGLVRARAEDRDGPLGTGVLAAGIVGGAVYAVGLLAFGDALARGLYGGQYDLGFPLLLWLAVLSFATASHLGIAVALRALERPNLIFRGQVLATVVVLPLGLLLMLFFGVSGVLAASAIAAVADTGYCWWLLQRGIAEDRVIGHRGHS
ncbi:MAG TPA: oligosaccharide flippase family protein [Egibacteraceae bacterium]|nr:oligosaccharide flippase family protein [Egibacteraceae bacterium]